MLEPIPQHEMPAVLEAIKDGRCCVCLGPIKPEHGGLYCCEHDDGCSHT